MGTLEPRNASLVPPTRTEQPIVFQLVNMFRKPKLIPIVCRGKPIAVLQRTTALQQSRQLDLILLATLFEQ